MSVMHYKDLHVVRGMFTRSWHPTLISLWLWVLVRYSSISLTVTSAFREGPGVHGTDFLRALDLRSKNMPDPQSVADDINNHWFYDPERPEFKVAVFGDENHLDHIHLQVHPNTEHLKG